MLMAAVTAAVVFAAVPMVAAPLPPMAFRSWNAYAQQVDARLMLRAAEVMVKKRAIVLEAAAIASERATDASAGAPTTVLRSMLDLGYSRVGVDDGWQDCGAGKRSCSRTHCGLRPSEGGTKQPARGLSVR